MGGTYTYYAFWNGDTIATFLTYIKMITGDASFNGLLKSVAVLGMFVMTAAAVLRQRGEDIAKWLAGLTMFYSIVLIPKVDVVVHDMRTSISTQVSGVPIGLALVATEASHVGKWLTEMYETVFIVDYDVAKFSKFGLVGPQRVLTAITSATMATPGFSESMDNFVVQCVLPELVDQPDKMNTLARSISPWTTIKTAGFLNPARFVQMPLVDGTGTNYSGGTADCITATMYLDQAFTSLSGYLIRQIGASSMADQLRGISDPEPVISSAILGSMNIMANSSKTVTQVLQDTIVLNALKNNSETSASPMVAWSVAVANQASAMNYETMAKVAENSLPLLRTAIEGVAIASFPILIIILIAAPAGAAIVLKGYAYLLIWVQLWPPLYAVVNSMSIAQDGNKFRTAVDALGGTTPQAMAWIAQMGPSSTQMAGMLALSVPVIALLLLKGGEQAFSSLTSSTTGPAQTSATSMGNSLAQGNVTAGNVSWGNTSAMNNSVNNTSTDGYSAQQRRGGPTTDMSTTSTAPDVARHTTPFGTVTGRGGNRVAETTGLQTADGSDFGKTQISQGAVATAQRNHSVATSLARTAQAAFGESVKAVMGQARAFEASGGTSMRSGQSYESSARSDKSSDWSNSVRALETAATSDTRTQGTDAQIGASGQLGTGKGGAGGGAASLGGAVSGGVTGKRGDSRDVRQVNASEDAKQAATALRNMRGHAESVAASSDNAAQRSAAQRLVASIDRALDASNTLQTALSNREEAGRSLALAQSGSVSTSATSAAPGIQQAVTAAGGDPAAALEQRFRGAAPDVGGLQSGAVAAPSGQATLGAGLSEPGAIPGTPSQAELTAKGSAAVSGAFSEGAGQVAQQGQKNSATVAQTWGAEGVSPSQPSAAAGYGKLQGEASGALASGNLSTEAMAAQTRAQSHIIAAVTSAVGGGATETQRAIAAVGQYWSRQDPQNMTPQQREQHMVAANALETLAVNPQSRSAAELASANRVVGGLIDRATQETAAHYDMPNIPLRSGKRSSE